MKIWIRYIGFLGLGIFLFISLISVTKNPEATIEGEWRELAWEYEKVDKNDTLNDDFKSVSGYVKEIAGQDLIIHKAEKWKFFSDGRLVLEGNNYTKEIAWTIKGRGNILELKSDKGTEHYSLTELSNNKLILNFDTNTHTRGIARLTFEKI